jgi:hypothetical protein
MTEDWQDGRGKTWKRYYSACRIDGTGRFALCHDERTGEPDNETIQELGSEY